MCDQLNTFLAKFCKVWQAGTDARLLIECHAGQVWVSLHQHILHPPAPPQKHPRRPGPSRLRRRARRAEARAAATAVAASTAEVAVQTDNLPRTAEVAVQAALVPAPVQPHQGPPAAQVDPVDRHDCAEQAQQCPTAAFHVRDAIFPELAEQAEPPHHDVPHPHPQQNIPQMDGLEDTQHVWSCKCCMFMKLFNTEDELQLHHNGPDDRGLPHFLNYEECAICYPWHVWS